jgi:hypothetical protein
VSISNIITERGIKEILHFTTNRGLLGVLASKALKARTNLTEDNYLEHIVLFNCPDRSRDANWHNYVNLSISRVTSLFGISANRWHAGYDGWWAVLSFDPEILTHEGVLFCTTNNMYSGCTRASGSDGLNALFADRIVQWSSYNSRSIIDRPIELSPEFTTCIQAECLYPDEVSSAYLQRIYVRNEEHVDAIFGMFAALHINEISCQVNPEVFSTFF